MSSLPDSVSATLYVVATPIGNLADLTERARQVLSAVNLIACEDTRHTQRLLQHLGLRKPMLSVHDHNERDRIQQVMDHLDQGRDIALVSDAGTPLISDPGYPLVQALRQAGHKVVPIPGASAMITALSAAGLPTDRFTFEGFLPHKSSGRKERLRAIVQDTCTLVFYEAKHRILNTLEDMSDVLGDQREAVVARELTKTFESFYRGTLMEIHAQLSSHDDHQKGEFVVMVHGAVVAEDNQDIGTVDVDRLLTLLLAELPVKKVARMVAELTGQSKNDLYQRALALRQG
jgi:16S rRNA (cytidine1402-2'-O)-methyltransferase